MERAICDLGIIPFFTSAIPGYSIKELTQPGFWFDGEEDSLGPWDWKIDCLQNGGLREVPLRGESRLRNHSLLPRTDELPSRHDNA